MCNSKGKLHNVEKKIIPLYLEHLPLVIKRAGWKVTKIHAHLTFQQKRFKKKFIPMNQKSRQESKYNIEKDFYRRFIRRFSLFLKLLHLCFLYFFTF